MRKGISSFVFLLVVAGSLVFPRGTPRAGEQGASDVSEEKIIGTWKLISAKYDDEEVELPELGTTLKHITPTGFVWLSYDPETKVVSRTAGGTYTLKGDQFEETPQYGLGGDFDTIRDKPQAFTIKIEGDRWRHSGVLSNGLKIEEVWERCRKE
jgi:hypothetical protein